MNYDPPLEMRVEALVWLGEAAGDPAEKRRYIEEALAYNPSDMRARRTLALLNGQLNPAEVVDPDRLAHPQAAAAAQPAGVDRFTCPQCGGRMTFTPDGSGLNCEYCESRRGAALGKAATDASAAQSFLTAMATRQGHLHPVNRQTFNCQGCGSTFILPAEQLSATCPYCGSAYAVRRAETRELLDPQLIFPFQVDENQARQALGAWLTGQRLAGEGGLQVERGLGIYLPAWSFEMAGQVPWNCLVEESRNKWVAQSNIEIVYHTGVLVPATTRLCAECAAEMKAFDLKQALPFNEDYLANWAAETYQVALGDASLEARRWTYEFEKDSVRGRMLQPVRDLTFNSLGITIESFRLVLLPFWLSHYHLGKERYQVAINGLTGAVRGQRPRNWLDKIFK
jgi:predicted RNA-binding Zn-ribbon protein involved in translation (DUF1610 family)